jgi:High potential iron-sulfur protein
MAKAFEPLSRRTFLGGVLVLPALSGLLAAKAAADSQKASQESMHYQTSPNGSKQCSNCNFFIPGSDANSNGTCKIVDGSISPHGYCMAYNAKSS